MERAKFPTVPETTIDPLLVHFPYVVGMWLSVENYPPIPSKTEKKGA